MGGFVVGDRMLGSVWVEKCWSLLALPISVSHLLTHLADYFIFFVAFSLKS